MMEQGTSGWRRTDEDNVSTCSSEGRTSERRLLRFPNMTRVTTSAKLKTSAAAVVVVMIAATTFGIVYTRTSGVGGAEELLAHHDVIRSATVPDLEELLKSNADQMMMVADDPLPLIQSDPKPSVTREKTSQSKALKSNAAPSPNASTPPSQVTSDNSTNTPKKKKTRRRKIHYPRKLPDNAQEKPALSLLLQMKLVQPPTASYVNYSHCVDTDSGKTLQIGWKAFVFVNTTLAGIPVDRNPFVGYGKDKASARKTASQCALSTIYPGKLEYPSEELDSIIKYCDDDLDENRPPVPGCY
ncbi:hypothetical protein Ocin01_07553 [Orchesella cincta]|uniref:Uncharacterized protein n=1 Tax=Orchesella cincta TaxID=48709 RepID=A0A1D2N1K0_ORCCI|nr:hypothetical protein Ocin01_07553 [Orchesella cincta]